MASRLEIVDHVATITLCREKERNSLDSKLLSSLGSQLTTCMKDESVHVIVLTNLGNTFSAGANLKSAQETCEYSLVDIFNLMQQGPKVIIGKINGHCTGGGVGLAAACDLSVIRDDVQVGFTEVRIGVAPAMISVICLPKMTRGKAAEMMLCGLKVSGQQAAEAGLFTAARSAEQMDGQVEEWVDQIRHGGPNALGATKSLIYRVPGMAPAEAFQWTQ
ncbi:unnamed protein product, partial [Durusdinium trenchii]